jgi:hypothetical protein
MHTMHTQMHTQALMRTNEPTEHAARAHKLSSPEAKGSNFQYNKIVMVPDDIMSAHALVAEVLIL